MATSAQVLANQQNALLSTGPTTEEGKAISSGNAFRHGCYAATLRFSSPEEEAAFDKLHAEFRRNYHPSCGAEEVCVYDLTRARWLEDHRAQEESATAIYLRKKLLQSPDPEDPEKPIEVRMAEIRVTNKTLRSLARRATQIRLMATAALKELQRLQKEFQTLMAERIRRQMDEQLGVIEFPSWPPQGAALSAPGNIGFDPFSLEDCPLEPPEDLRSPQPE